MKTVWRFFSSVRLAIILLIFLTLASILGTLIPQQQTPEEYTAHYGSLSRIITAIDLDRLYQSAWFIGLLLVFSLNIVVCSLTRLRSKLLKTFASDWTLEERELASLKTKDSFTQQSGARDPRTAARSELDRRHFRVGLEKGLRPRFPPRLESIRSASSGRTSSTWEFLSSWPEASSAVSAGIGRTSLLPKLKPYRSRPAPSRSASTSSRPNFIPSGAVKDWKSTVTIFEDGAPRLTQTIDVNHPLSYRGVAFYQSSYGWDWESPDLELRVMKKSDSAFVKIISLSPAEKAAPGRRDRDRRRPLPPRFRPGPDNEPATRSLEPINPAVLIE